MSTLYRNYRPQNFSEVIGQNHIKITLQNEIIAEQPASAYLFCGPRAVGKTTMARVLAKAVNCENRATDEFEPCNTCNACVSIMAGKNLDVVEIDAASNTGIDNVRENIIAFSRLAPTSAKFRVFIIDEVHMLSLSAFNALLKIIEEPPAQTIFILCTTEIQKVPGTVISRCERYDFKRISVKDIVKKLSYIAVNEKIVIESEILEAVARRSGGYLRDAESLLGQIFSLGDKQITREQAELVIPHYNSNEAISLLGYLSRKDAAKAVTLINNLMDSGINVKVFVEEIIELLRKIMLGKLSPELVDNLGLDLGESLEKRLVQVTGNLSWEQIFKFTHRFLEITSDYKNLSIPQLPLELAVAELCLGSTQSALRPSPALDASTFKRSNTIEKKDSVVSAPDPESSVLSKKSNLNFSETEITNKWPEFLMKIKKYNHSLSFVLQNCRPQKIKDGNLFLIFKYKFHQDRINNIDIKNIVKKTLAEVFGVNLTFSSVIADFSSVSPVNPVISQQSAAKTLKDQPPAGLVDNLLEVFGGEVIN